MYVKNLMVPKEELVTVTKEDSLQFALDLIEKNDFLSIPIVGKNKFYGVVTKELILKYFYRVTNEKSQIISLSDYKVEEVLKSDLPVLHMNDLVEAAANLLYLNKAVFVAVLDEAGEFKGIITHKDIFREFTSLFGLDKGKRISVKTGKPAVGDLNSIMHVLLDRFFQGQDFGFFSLGTNSWHNYLL